MRCYFLRHGLAAEANEWSGSDFDRPLTSDGVELMTREAKTIAALGLKLDVIITSPLVRAKQTAAIVAKKLEIPDRVVEDERLGAGFGPSRLVDILARHAGANAIMLVGHEPGMSGAIAHLAGGVALDFKKGSLARVDLADPATLQGELVWLIPPKVLAL
jgi:phosphohistidine phosphatase